jgi:NADH-quinone oxidoreductase subunit L
MVETPPPAGLLQDPLLDKMPWTILILPLAGFLVLWLFGDWIKKKGQGNGAGGLACGAALGSFAVAAWSALRLHGLLPSPEGLRFAQPVLGWPPSFDPAAPREPLYWIAAGGFQVPVNLLLDPLSAVMCLVVTGVGSLIHVYSLGYMAHDEEKVRYFSYLNLFLFFMLLLVLGGSLPLMFVGWEGVGLCSYLLIGFWFRKKSASDAGNKAFIVNRVGDAGLILGMILAFQLFGTLDLVDLAAGAPSLVREGLGEWGPATLVALLLFVGACGKSAQVPLHVWLPDAMEGPTPVSALIHAATMVTAGVYMVARLAPLYAASATALLVVAVVGAVTALLAATVALVQTDIKRVLAYSTVSQLGYMFLACGVGAFGVAVFHLFTHAFFKALLFLGSGSVIHALSGEQDMRRMGGLRARIPWTFATFLVGTLAIAGIWPLAGYFSKEAILGGVLDAHRTGLFAVALCTAGLTAFYMARLVFLTFFGEFRGDAEAGHHVHEAPATMLVPLVLLAAGSAGVGFLAVPHYLEPVFRLPAAGEAHHAAWLPLLATTLTVLAIGAAWFLYVLSPETPARVAAAARPLHRALEAKWGFDLLFDWLAGRVVVKGSETALWRGVDEGVIDGAVNGTAGVVGGLARAVRYTQAGLVRGYALLILGGAVALVAYLVFSS